MSVVFSGTWMATLPRLSVQTKIVFSSNNSTVKVEPVGGQITLPGIWAEDGNGHFVIQAVQPGSGINAVWTGTHDATSGSGFYVDYSHTRQLAALEPATFTKLS